MPALVIDALLPLPVDIHPLLAVSLRFWSLRIKKKAG
jgi:hypothetical protein